MICFSNQEFFLQNLEITADSRKYLSLNGKYCIEKNSRLMSRQSGKDLPRLDFRIIADCEIKYFPLSIFIDDGRLGCQP